MKKITTKLVIIVIIFVGVFSVHKYAHAACVLNNAYWAGPINTGQAISLYVNGTGCNGYTVAINVRKKLVVGSIGTSINPEMVFQTDTTASGHLILYKEDFDALRAGNETNMQLFFRADAGGSTKDSNYITFNDTGVTKPPTSGGTTGGNTGGNTGGSGSGQPVNFNFSIQPPSSYTDFTQLLDAISGWLIKIAIPLATIMILYAGVRFLFARGNPGEVTKARQILVYAIVGLAIVLIGSGFISLINSILGVDNSGSSSTQQNTGSSNQLPTSQ